MSLDLDTVDGASAVDALFDEEPSPLAVSLTDFVSEFGDELLESLNRSNPPVYAGHWAAQK